MNYVDKTVLSFTVMSLMVIVAGSARADWDKGDDHKMHWPQLPDPNGWDVDSHASTDVPYTAFTWPSGDDGASRS